MLCPLSTQRGVNVAGASQASHSQRVACRAYIRAPTARRKAALDFRRAGARLALARVGIIRAYEIEITPIDSASRPASRQAMTQVLTSWMTQVLRLG